MDLYNVKYNNVSIGNSLCKVLVVVLVCCGCIGCSHYRGSTFWGWGSAKEEYYEDGSVKSKEMTSESPIQLPKVEL